MRQKELEKLFEGVMGETVHTAFRKGCDSRAATKVWTAIRDMPGDDWGKAVEWMCWALAYSLHRQIKRARKTGA